MKLTAIPILFGVMFSGIRSSAALRRWAERDDPGGGWCTTLSRDHARAQRPPAGKPQAPKTPPE